MPLIDLRQIKTVFICPDHNEKFKERRRHMETILEKHGFQKIIMYKSGTDYPNCLRHALYNILQQNLENPVLILEDDIVFHKNPQLVFDIPADSDAFYFGILGYGMDFELTGGNRLIQTKDYVCHERNIIRIKNMLGAHAILYLGKEYKEKLSKMILYSDVPCDVDMCKIQPIYNIYGLCFPICWQSAKFNKDDFPENVSKIRINERGCWAWNEAIEDEDEK